MRIVELEDKLRRDFPRLAPFAFPMLRTPEGEVASCKATITWSKGNYPGSVCPVGVETSVDLGHI